MLKVLTTLDGVINKAKGLLFPTGSVTVNLSGGGGSTGDVLTKQSNGSLAFEAPSGISSALDDPDFWMMAD